MKRIIHVPALTGSRRPLASRLLASRAFATEVHQHTDPSSSAPPPFPSSSDSSKSKAQSQHEQQTPYSPPPPPPRRQLPANFGRNQLIPVPPDLERDCQRIVATFKAPIRYAFGYGSGVFPQKSYADQPKPLLDFIFAVSHPSHWHSINLQQNPKHYAAPLRWFGSGPISWLQEKGPGAGVWFNVDVELEGRRLKYGVVSLDSLCSDLLDWQTLYLAGRMQKPVYILRDDARVRLANQVNLASALRAALLTLPSSFSEVDLFAAVAGLSYRGDFRMSLGENPRKVRNIVDAQLDQFRALYRPLVRAFKNVSYSGAHLAPGMGEVRQLEQDMDPKARGETARKLPTGLRDKIEGSYDRKWNLQRAQRLAKLRKGEDVEPVRETDEAALWAKIAGDEGFDEVVSRGIASIVGRPTFNQSLKGILSAGPAKSLSYIVPKLRKRWDKGASKLALPNVASESKEATPESSDKKQ